MRWIHTLRWFQRSFWVFTTWWNSAWEDVFSPLKTQPKIMIFSESKMSIFESCFPCLASSFRQKLSSRCTCKELGVMDLAMSTYDFSYTLVSLVAWKGNGTPCFRENPRLVGNIFSPEFFFTWNLKSWWVSKFGISEFPGTSLQVNHVKFQGCISFG